MPGGERCEARGESSTAGGACPRSWLVRRQLPVCGGRLLRLGKWILFFPRIGSREEPSSGDRGGAGGSGVKVRKASLKALSVFKGVDMVGVRVGGT